MMDGSAGRQLTEMERDRLSAYVARSPTPRWFWPFFGMATAAMMAAHELDPPLLPIAAALIYAVGMGYISLRVLSRAGVVPRFRGMPATLRWPLVVFVVIGGLAAVVLPVATFALAVPWGFVEVGVVVGLVLAAGGWLASRSYERRADRLAAEFGVRR